MWFSWSSIISAKLTNRRICISFPRLWQRHHVLTKPWNTLTWTEKSLQGKTQLWNKQLHQKKLHFFSLLSYGYWSPFKKMRASLCPSWCLGIQCGLRNRTEPVSAGWQQWTLQCTSQSPLSCRSSLGAASAQDKCLAQGHIWFWGSLYPRTDQHRGIKAQPPRPSSGTFQQQSSHRVGWGLHCDSPSSTCPLSHPAFFLLPLQRWDSKSTS